MAKVLDPFGAREARGSVGGITASRNKAGQYLRINASPVQPRTSSVQAKRYAFQKLVREFNDLSVVNIDAWNDFGRDWTVTDAFGNSINNTGLDWYMALNTRLNAMGVTSISTPPLNPNPSYNPTISIAQESADSWIEATMSGFSIADSGVFIEWSNNLPRSRRFAQKSLRLRRIVTLGDVSPLTLIASSLLSMDDSVVQFRITAVDSKGRGTPALRQDVYPVSS